MNGGRTGSRRTGDHRDANTCSWDESDRTQGYAPTPTLDTPSFVDIPMNNAPPDAVVRRGTGPTGAPATSGTTLQAHRQEAGKGLRRLLKK